MKNDNYKQRPMPDYYHTNQLINQTINLLRDSFSSVFLKKNKQASEDLAPFKLQLFTDVWCQLALNMPNFDTVEELNTYYQNFAKQLPVYVQDFCSQNQIPIQSFSDEDVRMLQHLTDTYATLANQKYFLDRFKPNAADVSFCEELAIVDDIVRQHRRAFSTRHEETRHIEDALDNVNSQIMRAIRIHGYRIPGGDIELKDVAKNTNDHLFPKFVAIALDKLPETADLNASMDAMKAAYEQNNKQSMRAYRAELEKHHAQFADIKDELDELISNNADCCDAWLEQLIKQADELEARLMTIEQHRQVLDIPSDIRQLRMAAVDDASKWDTLKKMVSLRSSQWSPVEKQLAMPMAQLNTAMDSFKEYYTQEQQHVKKLTEMVEHMHKEKRMLDDQCTQFSAKVGKTRAMGVIIADTIKSVQQVIKSFSVTPDNSLLAFFKSLWPWHRKKTSVAASSVGFFAQSNKIPSGEHSARSSPRLVRH